MAMKRMVTMIADLSRGHAGLPRSALRVPRSAFSLLEVLLAVTLFSIALTALIQAVAVQVRAETLAEDTTRATILAQNLIEEIRYAGDYTDDAESGQFQEQDAAFEWQYDMQETDIAGLYRVQATVSWSDGLARKAHTISTYLAERQIASQAPIAGGQPR